MPVANGVAISIHAAGTRLGEYSIQRQTKFKRVTSYIRVPTPKIRDGRPEQSTFAISICLLREGMIVPYSDQPSDKDPDPHAIPVSCHIRKTMSEALPVRPWNRTTSDPNETVAAYIYFDGRAKEEVATLLRPGDETWVNSRWVSGPEADGGLAEREFIFKEVGIDKALGGLGITDLKSDETRKMDRAEKQHARAKRREARREAAKEYADHNGIDIEDIPHSSSDSSSDDEEKLAETAGQIKIVLFRVLATGEVKKGEYSPQFSAADDTEDPMMDEPDDGADLSHTAAFAKPKSLDPSTISTQTVQGIDGPDTPFATFTFLYRGDRQLKKMGILKEEPIDKSSKRKSRADIDFSNLKPLTPKGTVGFTTRRDQLSNNNKSDRAKSNGKGKTKKRKSGTPSDSDSDGDDSVTPKKTSPPHSAGGSNSGDDNVNDLKRSASKTLSPTDRARVDSIAEGLRKTRLKRQHSAELEDREPQILASPQNASGPIAPPFPAGSTTPPDDLDITSPVKLSEESDGTSQASAPAVGTRTPSLSISQSAFSSSGPNEEPVIGSPFKRHRTSMDADGFGGRSGAMNFPGPGLLDFKKMVDSGDESVTAKNSGSAPNKSGESDGEIHTLSERDMMGLGLGTIIEYVDFGPELRRKGGLSNGMWLEPALPISKGVDDEPASGKQKAAAKTEKGGDPLELMMDGGTWEEGDA